MTVNPTVFAAMPNASVSTTVALKPRSRRSSRTPCRRSLQKSVMRLPLDERSATVTRRLCRGG
jgi:hypothetical protein